MAKSVSVTINGKMYASRSAAAKELVAGGMSLKETAITVGMKYQTVYAVTKGATKVTKRVSKYRAVRLAKSGKLTAGAIAKKVNMPATTLRDMLKRMGISAKQIEKKVKNPVVDAPIAAEAAPVTETPAA